MGEAIIEVRNLSKKFGSFTAVDNISFEVYKGEILVFLGQMDRKQLP
jgi:ABC-2 type transport system ATP-binding protein